mgnify:CR=1 FL=1
MSLFSIAAKFALKGASKRVPEDIMSGTVRRIKQEAQLPETPSRVLGKDPEKYTGPHSDFKRIVEDYVPFTKVDETQDVLRALGRTEDDITQFKKSTSKGGQKLTKEEKKVYSNPKLEKEARNLDEGLITLGEFKEMRDILKPRRTYGTVPKLFDDFDILGSIGQKVKDHGIIGVNKNIKQGTKVDTRFDINAYKNYGRYVVTIRKDGDVFGYAPTAILKNVKFAGHIPPTKEGAKTLGQKAFNVAKREETKNPFAVMEGKWQDVSPESTQRYALNLMKKGKVNKYGETDKEWTEIGFDPSAKTSFYNRSTGEPIFEAEKVVQVGSMLLARGIKKATPTQLKQLRFTIQSGKELEGYKQGGQVSEGLSSIVSRAKGGKTKRKKKDKDFYADFDRKGKPTPELSNRIAISRLMEDLEWERINKEVKRKRREEAEQWEDMKFIQEAMKEDKKGTQMFMPNQDLYKNPIFKDVVTKRKDGGGLSNIKKSININGQPHSLAWINPDEASALKAMGGSGKKGPMGIPSYQTDEDYSWDWGDTGGYDYGAGKTEADIAADPGRDVDTGYSEEEIRDYALSIAPPGTTPFQARRNLGPIGTAQAKAEHHDQLTDMRKGILGLYGDRMTRGEALEGAKRSAFTTWRNTVGKYSTDTPKDYEEWFAAQDPNALIAGYKIGDPVGMAMQSSFDIVNKQLKKKFKDARDDKAVGLDDDEEFEMTREELGEIVESAKVEGLKDFTPYSGLDYPVWAPGGTAIKAMDFFSRTVIGTGTVGGVGVHLHKDGSVTPISPEDSPGFDHEAMKGENVEPVRRRRRGPPPVAPAATLPPEAPAKGTMKRYYADLGTPATRLEGLRSLTREGGPLSQVYTEEQIEDFNLA